jgi:hypothetical protein
VRTSTPYFVRGRLFAVSQRTGTTRLDVMNPADSGESAGFTWQAGRLSPYGTDFFATALASLLTLDTGHRRPPTA